jgi:hypothetical protein
MTDNRHLCLVSNQPVPSLTPLIDLNLRVTHATLVAEPDRKQHAQWLKSALDKHGVHSEIILLRDGYNLPALRQEFAALAARYPAGVTVNLTGGTKLMTLAAWEAFTRPQDRLYYVHIGHDRIDWLHPADQPSHAIADRVRLDAYLAALGIELLSPGPQRQALGQAHYQNLHSRARKLQRQRGPSRTNAVAGGGWLEELVFEEIRRLAQQDPKIHDVARQFRINYGAQFQHQLVSELDIACLRDNTLYLIECKTGQSGVGASASTALFKLAELSDTLGGVRGRAIFVSTEIVSSALHTRGRQLGIKIIDRACLDDLSGHLDQALRTSPLPGQTPAAIASLPIPPG